MKKNYFNLFVGLVFLGVLSGTEAFGGTGS